jgi:DNA transformation protein
MKLNYHTPPAEALESPALMLPWARLALEAALAARRPTVAKAAVRKPVARGKTPGVAR